MYNLIKEFRAGLPRGRGGKFENLRFSLRQKKNVFLLNTSGLCPKDCLLIFMSVVFSILLTNCNTTNSDASPGIDSNVRIVYRDADGNNLLNPDNPHAITEQNTDIYFLIDGKKEKIFKGNLDSPKMFHIEKGDSTIPYEYFMHLYANTISGQDTATTYIKFDDGSMDTVTVGYELSDSRYSGHITKVWYNQKLCFDQGEDAEQNPLRYIVVLKEVQG